MKRQRKKVEFPVRSGAIEEVYPTGDIVVEIYCQNCEAEAGRRNTLISLFLLPNFLLIKRSLVYTVLRGEPYLSRSRSEKALE